MNTLAVEIPVMARFIPAKENTIYVVQGTQNPVTGQPWIISKRNLEFSAKNAGMTLENYIHSIRTRGAMASGVIRKAGEEYTKKDGSKDVYKVDSCELTDVLDNASRAELQGYKANNIITLPTGEQIDTETGELVEDPQVEEVIG